MKSFLVFAQVVVFVPVVYCQEKAGIYNSNYATTNSIFLNPSSSADAGTYMQCNLVGVSAHFMNNVAFLPDFSLWKALAGGSAPLEPTTLRLNKFLRVTASAEAPAFVISKNNFGAGIFVRGRSVTGVVRIPYQLTDLFLDLNNNAADDPAQVDVRRLRAGSMTWVEYGANFSWIVKKQKNNLLAVGGNLRYLTGLNAVYANIIRFNGVASGASANGDLDARLRYNQFAWASGWGVGVDLGVTYKKMLAPVDNYFVHSTRSGCKTVGYKYKLAVSLRDLGAIRFRKNTTQVYAKGSGVFHADTANYDEQFSTNFSGAINNNSFFSTLPGAVSVQYDYNFENHLYLNGTLVKNLVPNRVIGAQGADLLAITPRVEFKYFEAALPLTFTRFMYPQLGVAFRVRSFVVGVDNLFPLIIAKNTYGLGVYFNLGFSIFTNKGCRKPVRTLDACASGFSLFKRNKNKTTVSRKKKQLGGKKRRVLFQSGE